MISAKDLKDLFGESSPDKVILKAQKLQARGRNDQALAVMKEAIGRLGEVADLRIEMATLQLAAGRPREAADSLRALLKADTTQVRRVEEFIGWARTQFSDVEALHEPMAEGHIARRNFTAAVDVLERIDKKTLESGLEGRLANLKRFIEKGAMVPKSALPTLYFAALAYEAIGDWHKGLDIYRKILAASPTEFPAVDERLKGLVARNYKVTALRLAYAELLESAGKHERSWEEHLKALEVDPRCAAHVGRFIDSRLQSSPEDANLLWACSRVRLAEGRTEEALEICGKLADGGNHLPEIEKLVEELSSGGKETVDTLLLLARVALAQGKVPRALSAISNAINNEAGERGIKALEQVLAANPSEPRAHQMLADCHLKEGRVEKSLEAYRALRRVDAGSAPLIATRLRAVLASDPSNTAARELMEEVCVEAGDIQEAVPLLRSRLRRGEQDARETLERLRQMLLASPSEASLKSAAAEACLTVNDPVAAWGYLKDVIQPQQPPEPELLHLMVLCAGANAEICRTVISHLSGLPRTWVDRPEVVFALAESAGRAGLLREALDRFHKAESMAPETVPVCHAAIRSLVTRIQEAGSETGEDRALLAEALLDIGDPAAATETLRGAADLPVSLASRLVEKLTEALRKNPADLSLSAALAGVCLASGQVARAMSIARSAIAERDDAASAPLTMIYGDALSRSGRQAEATRAYASSVRRDPALAPKVIERLQMVVQIDMGVETAHLTLGRLLVNEGQVVEGVNALMCAWAAKADLAPHVLKDLDQTARRFPAEPAVDLARAQLLLAAGEPAAAAAALGARCRDTDAGIIDEVVARLEGIAAKHPKCARAQLELGRAYLAKRWAARACACLVRAYELDRTLADAVAQPLSQIQKQFPDEPEAHIARGAIYEGEGRVVPAAEAYLKAVCLPGSGASAGLARLARLSASGRTIPAEVHLTHSRACRLSGDLSGCVEAARRALDGGGDLATQVRSEMDLLVDKHPMSALARLGRASACIQVLDMESASQDLTEALRFDPSSSDSVAALAREIIKRRPTFAPGAVALANALMTNGDEAGASRALDSALSCPEASSDVGLLLARRRLALKSGDASVAQELLARAESSCSNRNELLEMLHQETMASQEGWGRADGIPTAAGEAIGRGEYFRAAELLAAEPASYAKAWVLERCGRYAEAAACLRDLMSDGRAAARFATLHDEMVARELEGRAPALMGETTLQFEITNRRTETVQGGVR